MKKLPSIGEYVVLNKNPDATIYVVSGACLQLVDLIDAECDPSKNPRPYTCCKSLVEYASKEQLLRIIKL